GRGPGVPVEAGFLEHITADPDDRVSRLAFADWLAERDDPAQVARGEFIRVQQALLAKNLPADERRVLVARERDLLTKHRDNWDEPIRGLASGWEYRGGFVERVTLTAERFVDHFARLCAVAPVVRVRLTGLTPDTVEVLAAEESLSRVLELDLNRAQVRPDVLQYLLASTHLTRLRALNLTRTGIGNPGVSAVVGSPVFHRLRYLNLSHVNMTESATLRLVNEIRNRPTALTSLVLRGVPRLTGTPAPLPPSVPLGVRQALQSQVGLPVASRVSLLEQLHARRLTLSPALREWVDRLHGRKTWEVTQAVKELPLPEPVERAFGEVCQRWAVWQARRTNADLPALPLKADGRTIDLPAAVRVLVGAAWAADEVRALVDALPDLFLRHERGDLPPDGRTRGSPPVV
ncbi:MAG: TIGR02996 domain-containing protein, partial [Gemmataceae bacterium]|nr:TIGR02996 domain-containing protein [Gemmataceae bacterium]